MKFKEVEREENWRERKKRKREEGEVGKKEKKRRSKIRRVIAMEWMEMDGENIMR